MRFLWSRLCVLSKVVLMFKSKSLIKMFTEAEYATLLERPPAGDLSINQLQKLLLRQLPLPLTGIPSSCFVTILLIETIFWNYQMLTWNSWTMLIPVRWSARNLFKSWNRWNDGNLTWLIPPSFPLPSLFLSFFVFMLTASPCNNPFKKVARSWNWFYWTLISKISLAFFENWTI